MFKSEEMQRVRVYGEKPNLNGIVDGLYDFGAIHVTQAKHDFMKEYGQVLESFKDISTALIAVRAASQILNIKAKPIETEMTLQDALGSCQTTGVYKVVQLNEEKEKLLQAKRGLEDLLANIEPLALFDIDRKMMQVKSLGFTIFQTTYSPKVKEDFANVSGTAVSTKVTGKTAFYLVAFEKSQEDAINKLVAKHALKVFQLKSTDSNFASDVAKAKSEINSINKQLAVIESQFSEISGKNSTKIAAIEKILEAESKKAQLPFYFGETSKLIAVEGWVPKKIVSELETELSRKVKNVYVEFITTSELPPTKLNNPRPISSFEELVKFFSLPKSTELDPTALIAISFPLFFGMIVGDMGYGIVSLLLAILIKNKMAKDDVFMQAFGTMLAVCSVSSIIFGYIFGEFFGFEHIFGIITLHPIIGRVEEEGLAMLMALSILFGIIHLAIGYILGAYQAFKHNHAKHGYAKLSWLLMEFAFVLFIAGNLKVPFLQLMEPLAEIITPAISGPAMLVALIGIIVFEGVTAVFELPTLISNICSYLRIMALGVSGVVIALILNKIPESVSFADPVSIIVSILLLALYVLGHLAGIALALFESTIQSMRLQFVEFYSKFFEGGGVQFNALSTKKHLN
ncbi:MAG: V-type ATPase 116kDa subunit family protein [Candidatus Micrarchaeota archaeon]